VGLAELGFILVQVDGMGTASRSRTFHDLAWKNIKDAGFPDRILWHRAIAAQYPWCDISRVGKYFDLLIFPGEDHAAGRRGATPPMGT